ncbi:MULTISPECIES: Eco57I restriction-modification methylase domain-containing protein [unclassified Rathayibacter]|uniref:Eco57I restriction-modification methylase domain-containing protein n=1 Tax=unclassified Rathayibacter TaxID=2609250 RepID=UPI0006FAFACF|nr:MULTISPECIES: class I SAM-dependent methyltransferase [unclassified Rathayibacter]KQQ06412.1 modification methylase [Rathayibacter sp. Leaf294]KQS14276.1 modification methylase [Rathayibacter sp. Leaf185]
MRTRDVVSAEKLRGGFYSPDVLVDLCLGRSSELLRGKQHVRVLEPSAGDGAFIRGLDRTDLGRAVAHVEAVEIFESEAQKAMEALSRSGIPGAVHIANVLEWNQGRSGTFDLALGNPPYVRFQFVSLEDKQRALAIGNQLGITGSAVSNLWIPVFLLAVERLAAGGVFSMILPTEFLTGVSAGRVRAWLLATTRDLTIDLFKPGSFPAVLQEVLVLTGRKADSAQDASKTVRFFDHNGGTHQWRHEVSPAAKTWTSYLLNPEQESALTECARLEGITRLGSEVRFSVSTVTGANEYFCVDTATVEENDLSQWALPLLPRTRYAPGLTYSKEEHLELADTTAAAWMLHFAADKPVPTQYSRAGSYIATGETAELHERFKCRVRTPWYRVPVVQPGQLLMSKRSNLFPRVIVNQAGVVTTDTIYRGHMLPTSTLTANDVAASFHNSLTLLSVETDGRSFGGGVLELVPSEVASLLFPAAPAAHKELDKLDRIARTDPSPEALIEATDRLLPQWIPGLTPDLLHLVQEARHELLQRRTVRSHGKFFGLET